MKKSRLNRYTRLKPGTMGLARSPMKPSTKELKRTPIKKVSAQKRTRDAADEPHLAEYRRLFPLCQNCGWRDATDIHEIFSQGRRHIARQHRSCILHLCGWCHPKIQYWPKAKQLALKAWADAKGFDLLEYNRLSPGMPVSMAEVDAARERATKD